jgi:hypothetical protein
MQKKHLVIGALTLPAIALVTWIVTWLWLLAVSNPLDHPAARFPLWPVACSTRGCVTSASWVRQHDVTTTFARATGEREPLPEQSLTTVIRHHIVRYAFLRSPVTPADASRYRENVLRITQEDQLQTAVGMSLAAYDREIILPFLKQEALRQQHEVESTGELYAILNQDRFILLLPFQLRWDTTTGEVMPRQTRD